MAIPIANENTELQELCSLLLGMQNGTVTLKDSAAVCYIVIHSPMM